MAVFPRYLRFFVVVKTTNTKPASNEGRLYYKNTRMNMKMIHKLMKPILLVLEQTIDERLLNSFLS